jgi:hypothetical protein
MVEGEVQLTCIDRAGNLARLPQSVHTLHAARAGDGR